MFWNECCLLCHGLSAVYFYSWKNVFMLGDIRCWYDLLCRGKGKILCWILKCKFYGSQKAFWESDEEIEGRDQQVIKEWGKSFDMRFIIRISADGVDLQAIIPTLAVRNYVQLLLWISKRKMLLGLVHWDHVLTNPIAVALSNKVRMNILKNSPLPVVWGGI